MTAGFSVKEDIEFRAHDGVALRGWVVRPDSEGPHPTIVMSPGFTGSITRLVEVAGAFVDHGFAVLMYDHRTCGRSGGEPRHDVDPCAQDRDMQMALSYAEQHPALDGDRIGLWGASYSGGNVLVVAALDHRVKAVVSEVPFIAGYEQFVISAGPDAIAFIDQMLEEDRRAFLNGAEPGRVALVRDPGEAADHFVLFDDEGTYTYLAGGPDGAAEGWLNSVTTRSMSRALAYDVRGFMRRISPTPLMMIVAEDDETTPPALAQEAFELALEPKELVLITGGHYGVFDPHRSLGVVVDAALRWFETHLGVRG